MDSHTPPLITLIAVQIPSNSQNSQKLFQKNDPTGSENMLPRKKGELGKNIILPMNGCRDFLLAELAMFKPIFPEWIPQSPVDFSLGKIGTVGQTRGPNPSRLW